MAGLHIEKLQSVPVLLDIYGSLLTERQQEAISLFYEEDLSLSEIASLHGSSRQAAHSLIERGEAQLAEYEAALHLSEKERLRDENTRRVLSLLEEAHVDAAVRKQVEELLCHL